MRGFVVRLYRISDKVYSLLHPDPKPQPTTPEERYYNSEQHFREMPYRVGDRLPKYWVMNEAWPSWGRPVRVEGERACPECRGRGCILYGDYSRPLISDDRILYEKDCDPCGGTGIAGEKQRRYEEAWLRQTGFSSMEEYYRHQAVLAQQRRQGAEEATRRQRRESCSSCGGSGRRAYAYRENAENVTCLRCNGTGKRVWYRYR